MPSRYRAGRRLAAALLAVLGLSTPSLAETPAPEPLGASPAADAGCPPLDQTRAEEVKQLIQDATRTLNGAHATGVQVLTQQLQLKLSPCAAHAEALRRAAVDPDTGRVLAVGVGLAPEATKGAQARLLAMRAARVDLFRWLGLHRRWAEDPAATPTGGTVTLRGRPQLVAQGFDPESRVAVLVALAPEP